MLTKSAPDLNIDSLEKLRRELEETGAFSFVLEPDDNVSSTSSSGSKNAKAVPASAERVAARSDIAWFFDILLSISLFNLAY